MVRSVFTYRDYHAFLRDRLRAPSRGSRPPSLTLLARRLGYRSKRGIGMVLEGKRHPSTEMLGRISNHLDLAPEERHYLELLVKKERGRSRGVAVAPTDDELARANPHESAQVFFDLDRFAPISRWYYLPVFYLAGLPGFREDAAHIRARLRRKITCAEATEALRTLERIGMLARDAEGKLRPVLDSIATSHDVPSSAIRNHHRQMLRRALEAIEEQPVEAREISSVTLRLDPSRIAEAKRYLVTLRETFRKRFEDDEGEAIFQLNVQLFEHTTKRVSS